MEWLYLELNNKKLRINKNDSLDIYYWREYKTKPDDWYKIKITIDTKKSGYKCCRFTINKNYYGLSRIIYKAHNKDWDIKDNSNLNWIDHINRDSTDNRIENLRILTNQQNQWNTNAKGYCWDNLANKWRSQIRLNGKVKHLGYFEKEKDAKQAYLKAKEVYHKM